MTVQRELYRDPFWQPFSTKDDKPVPIEHALDLRDVRDQVRYTASLASGFRPVFEEMAPLWACDFERRVIYWRPTLPFRPYGALSPKEILFLTLHEAGHLNFTGGWVTPDTWSGAKQRAFGGFLNCVEDIRIERLMGREFSGFNEIRRECNRRWIKLHTSYSSMQYAVWDQVGLNWLQIESNDPGVLDCGVGTHNSQRFAAELWPEIDRIVHAPTTDHVAQAITPIFERLWEAQEEELKYNRRWGYDQRHFGKSLSNRGSPEDEAGKFAGIGSGFPEEPSAETWDAHPEHRDTLTKHEQLKEISKSAKGDAKAALEQMEKGEQKAQADAKVAKRKVEATNSDTGGGIGTESDVNPRPPADHWARAKDRMDPQIRALSHRLRATLKTNAMSDWSEGLRRGRLNTRRAKRAVAGNNRIFRVRREIGARDYFFGIVDDCSGSMKTTRVSDRSVCLYVLDATVLIAEAFERAEMQSFVVTHDALMRSAKGVRQRLRDVCEQLGSDIALSNGGTYEAPALIVAQEQFRAVRSGHKVLFVLSDGKTSRQQDSVRLIRELEREGVHMIALGLKIDPPKHYANKVRVDDIASLVHVLPRMINEIVRKGGR